MRLPRRWFLVTLLALACLGAAGWLLLAHYGGEFVKSGVRSALDEALPLPYETGEIAFRPGWGLTVEDLRVHAPEGEDRPDLLAVENVRVVLGLLDMIRGEVSVEKVVLAGVELHLPTDRERLAALQDLFPEGEDGAPLPPVILRGANIHLDPAPEWMPGGFLEGLGLSFVPREDGSWNLFYRTGLAGKGRANGTMRGGGPGPFRADLELTGVRLDDDLRSLLPAPAQAAWDRLHPRGKVSGKARVRIEEEDPVGWTGSAELTADLAGLGRLDAKVQGTGKGPLEVEVELPALVMDDDLRSRLPDTARTLWDRLRPRGRAAARGRGRIEGGTLAEGAATLDLEGVTLTTREPDIVWEGLKGRLEINIERPAGGHSPPARFRVSKPVRGRLGGKGSGAGFTIEGGGTTAGEGSLDFKVRAKGLDLETDLEMILPDTGPEIRRDFAATGSVDVDLAVRGPLSRPRMDIAMRLREGSMSYVDFPYPLTGIAGEVQVRTRIDPDGPGDLVVPEVLTLDGLEGVNSQTGVKARVEQGALTFAEGPDARDQLDLTIRSPGLVVDAALGEALGPETWDALRSLGLKGTFPVEVRIFTTPEIDPEVVAKIRIEEPVELRSEEVPYTLHLVGGESDFTLSTGVVRFRGLKGDPARGPAFGIDGSLMPLPNGAGSRLHLEGTIGPGESVPGLQLEDPAFRAALPQDARASLEEYRVRGIVTGVVRADVMMRGEEERFDYEADLRLAGGAFEVDETQAAVETDLSLRGRGAEWTLKVKKADLRFGKIHLTGVEGDLGRGSFAVPASVQEKWGGRTEIRTGLKADLNEGALFGGKANAHFLCDLEDSRYGVRIEGRDVDMAQVGKALDPDDDLTRGTLSAEVEWRGSFRESVKIDGDGRIDIVGGDLAHIPTAQVFLTNPIFGIFRTGEKSRTIEEFHAKFSLEGDRAVVHKYEDLAMEAKGGRVEGRGYLTFDGYLDMRFEPRRSMLGIPIVSQTFNKMTGVRFKGTLKELRAEEAPATPSGN